MGDALDWQHQIRETYGQTLILFDCILHYTEYYVGFMTIIFQNVKAKMGIATRYGLGGRGNESRLRRDLPQPTIAVLGTTEPPIQSAPGTFPGGTAAGRGVNHPPPPRAGLKKQ